MLPQVENCEAYDGLDRKDGVFQKAAETIAKKQGLSEKPTLFSQGSAFVYSVGDAVIKLFAPLYADLYVTEVASLEYLGMCGDIPSARLRATGEIEGWPYLLMEKLPGSVATDLWPNLSQPSRKKIVGQAARLMANLHLLENPGSGVPEPDWEKFLQGQVDGCSERQRSFGLDPYWMEQIPDFLSSVDLNFNESCFLHTEMAQEHLLVDPKSCDIQGVIDFEPAMVGDPEYDLVSVGIFLTCGDADLFQHFLQNYNAKLLKDHLLSDRVMAYALLHRYSNMRWYIEMLPKAQTIAELAKLWWPVS